MAAPGGLEQYVNTVRSLSAQGNWTQLCETISKSGEVLSKHSTHLDTALGTFDIQQHSLGVLGILCIKYNLQCIPDFETLFAQTQEFIETCNGEQVRYATDSYAELCIKFAQQLIDRKQPVRGIVILSKAITKIQLHSAQLTSIHSSLALLCLMSMMFKPALKFLDVDITEISKEGGHFDARHLLLYYYYGGMIYTALKNYDRAVYFFEVAVTTPAMAVSHIVLESYKKYILTALIGQGKLPTLPKYTSQVVGRYVKPLCQPYHDLASAYASSNPVELRNQVTKHSDVFLRDNNMGLVKQVITSMSKRNIQRLTKTFLTLSLADMANRVQLSGPKDAEKYVLHMSEDGEIFASINQRDGMVSFHDNPEKYNDVEMLKKLDGEMHKCIRLDEQLKGMDREIAVNAQFVQKSVYNDEDISGSSSSLKVQGYTM